MNLTSTIRKIRNQAGVTLIEAMIGLAVFAVGWAGVLSLITTSFDTTARTWRSKTAYQLMDRQFWELFYRVKTHKSEKLDLSDIAGTYTGGGVFPGDLLASGLGVEMLVVPRAELADDGATPPRVFIATEAGGAEGIEFHPNPGGDYGGYLVRWERSADPTVFSLGDAIAGRMSYTFVNDESFNKISGGAKQSVATYDVTVTVAWPYFEDKPSISLSKQITRTFSLGIY